MRFLPRFSEPVNGDPAQDAVEDIIRQEAHSGGKLFGEVPKGHDRQFFCLDEHTWVWHEGWSDQNGKHSITTRYEIRPNGVFKVQNGGSYKSLSLNEAKNLLRAAELYKNNVLKRYETALSA